jgi:hypothetical protein
LVSRDEVACAWTTWDPERNTSSVQIDILAPLETPSLVASLQETPPPGNDFLLGALALGARTLRLLCADFDSATGSITYGSASFVDGPSGWISASQLQPLGPSSPDTSYYEVGEVSWMSSYQGSVVGAFVSASPTLASLDLVEWKALEPRAPQRLRPLQRKARVMTRKPVAKKPLTWWPEVTAGLVVLFGAVMFARHTKRRRPRRRNARPIGAFLPQGLPRQRWE